MFSRWPTFGHSRTKGMFVILDSIADVIVRIATYQSEAVRAEQQRRAENHAALLHMELRA